MKLDINFTHFFIKQKFAEWVMLIFVVGVMGFFSSESINSPIKQDEGVYFLARCATYSVVSVTMLFTVFLYPLVTYFMCKIVYFIKKDYFYSKLNLSIPASSFIYILVFILFSRFPVGINNFLYFPAEGYIIVIIDLAWVYFFSVFLARGHGGFEAR